MKLSVIIPVYNTEKYLSRCLQSVCIQDFEPSQYEIIIINDGSTDNSKEIILRFQKCYSNIICIDQKNQGVSAARNAGLEVATGEYITFVDADDEIYQNSLRRIVKYCSDNSLDLLYPSISYIDISSNITGEFQMDDTSGIISDGFTHQRRGFIFAFYNKDILKNLRFHEEIPIAEDSLFNLFVHLKAAKCSYLHEPYYKYRKTPGSAINSDISQSEKAFQGYITIIDEICGYIGRERKNLTSSKLAYFNRPLFITAKMALEANVIPSKSQKRYFELVRKTNKINNKNIIHSLKNAFPLYGHSWWLFMAHHYYRKYINALKWKLFRYQ